MRRAGGGGGDAGRDAGGPVRGARRARRARRRASAGRRAEAEDCGRAAGGVRARRAGVWHKHTGSGPRAASVRRACHPCEPVRREFGHRVGRSRDAVVRRCAPLDGPSAANTGTHPVSPPRAAARTADTTCFNIVAFAASARGSVPPCRLGADSRFARRRRETRRRTPPRAFRGPPRAAPALTLRPRRPATRRRARSSATATGSSRRARRDRGTWSRACDRTRSPLR